MTRPRHASALFRAAGALFALSLLAACSHGSGGSATSAAARYAAHAKANYVPPGPPEDPWGPYIREASSRFDMPELWIRSLMRVESGGKLYQNGQLITSSAGAMGLMQVMPGTYDELRERHNLGDDAFDPHDNVMAGVAYMREMYDIYGSPGFLAAYNAGPSRLDDYLANNRPRPDETRRYVAMIGPNLAGVWPSSRSPAESYAMNELPVRIPPGTRYGRSAQYAYAGGSGRDAYTGGTGRVATRSSVVVAQLPTPPVVAMPYVPTPVRAAPEPEPQRVAYAPPPPPPARSSRFALIPSAMAAEPIPFRRGGGASGQWAIQVGAYANQNQAHAALGAAKDRARTELAVAHPYVGMVHQARGNLWRARLTGLSRETAMQACEKLQRGRTNCFVLSPDAQS